jgi:hypothetical protein
VFFFSVFVSILYSTNLYHCALGLFLNLHGSCGCLYTKVHSEWIGESWIESAGGFRCWNWRLSLVAELRRSIWVWVLLCIGICFLLLVLIFFRVASSCVSLSGWAVFFRLWCALLISVFCRDACPGISLHFSGIDHHYPFAPSDRSGYAEWMQYAWIYLLRLTWILHFFAQAPILLMVAWSFIEAIAGSSCVAKVALHRRRKQLSCCLMPGCRLCRWDIGPVLRNFLSVCLLKFSWRLWLKESLRLIWF